MKLLILTHNFPPRRSVSRNAGTFVFSFALALSKLGHQVYVLMPDTGEEPKENYPEFKVSWFNWRGRGKELRRLRWYSPGDILNLFSLIKNGVGSAIKLVEAEGIEYCQALWIIPGGYFAYKVKKRFGIPYSVWVLGADIWTYGRHFMLRNIIMRKIMREARIVFSNSRYLRQEVKDIFKREAKILYALRYLPQDASPAIIDNKRSNFLFIGRYDKVKGLDILLKALRLLLKEGRDIYLYAFGGGILENYYRELIQELGLKERVSLGGYASPETVVSFMKACSCLIIPSRNESQPVLLMDAIQARIPVIVSRVGDMGEIVNRLQIGTAVASEDIIGLKEALANFIDRGRAYYQLNLEKASQTINVSSMAKEYIEAISIDKK